MNNYHKISNYDKIQKKKYQRTIFKLRSDRKKPKKKKKKIRNVITHLESNEGSRDATSGQRRKAREGEVSLLVNTSR